MVEWFSVVALPVLCSFVPSLDSSVASVVPPLMLSISVAPVLVCLLSLCILRFLCIRSVFLMDALVFERSWESLWEFLPITNAHVTFTEPTTR